MRFITDTHIQIARDVALQSQCVRRKYGCVITNGIDTVATNNQRVSNCCNDGCVRDLLRVEHGGRTDVGAEIHAEQAALIRWNHVVDKNTQVLIQGFYKAEKTPSFDDALYPCHTCAMMLKFAGFRNVVISRANGELYGVSLSTILEYWEKELDVSP
jgi:deoxycytidylate deaminase